LTWYTKKESTLTAKERDEAIEAERRAVREEENQRMLEALGLAPKRKPQPLGVNGAAVSQLSSVELKAALSRGQTSVLPEGVEDTKKGGDRVAGLGFAPAPQHELMNSSHLERVADSMFAAAPTALPGTGNASSRSASKTQSPGFGSAVQV
jgi:hypothetical protein